MITLLALMTSAHGYAPCSTVVFTELDLEAALVTASAGDVICVDSFDITNQLEPHVPVTLRGFTTGSTLVGLGDSPMFKLDSADLTIEGLTLDGSFVVQLIEVRNGYALTLIDANLRNGFANDGGCVEADDAIVVMSGGSMEYCFADSRGGAMYLRDSVVVVEDARFSFNAALDRGGAVAIQQGADHTIVRTVFEANYVEGRGGGGLYLENVDGGLYAELEVADNTAVNGDGGGGIYLRGGPIELLDSTFTGNTSTDAGGALYVDDGGESRLEGLLFAGNEAAADSGRGGGACGQNASRQEAYCRTARQHQAALGLAIR